MQVIWELQKAIYEKLTDTDRDLVEKVSGVYHYVPQNTIFPYIVIFENKAKEISNFSETIFEVQTEIHVFDKSESNSDLLSLVDDTVNILKDISNFTIIGHSLIDLELLSVNSLLMDDRKTWKCELFFNFIVKKI
ncbi:DUF3168 domain-containing protein [Pseudomonadota bacterium]